MTRPDGQPAANICVNAAADTPNGPNGIGNANTAPTAPTRSTGSRRWRSRCSSRTATTPGPTSTEFWNDKPDYQSADAITLSRRPAPDRHRRPARRGRRDPRHGHELQWPTGGGHLRAGDDQLVRGRPRPHRQQRCVHDRPLAAGRLPRAVRRLQRHAHLRRAVVGRPADRGDRAARARRRRTDRRPHRRDARVGCDRGRSRGRC